jgi:hypothetical protein
MQFESRIYLSFISWFKLIIFNLNSEFLLVTILMILIDLVFLFLNNSTLLFVSNWIMIFRLIVLIIDLFVLVIIRRSRLIILIIGVMMSLFIVIVVLITVPLDIRRRWNHIRVTII